MGRQDFETTTPWTAIEQLSMHPSGTNNNAVHWSIRRWTSDYTGTANISWTIDKESSSGWRHRNSSEKRCGCFASPYSLAVTVQVNTEFMLDLAVGDLVELAILTPEGPGGDQRDQNDRTALTMSITPVLDQRQFSRPDGARYDIGAFEGVVTSTTNVPLIVNSLGDKDDRDPSNGSMTLREAINLANLRAGQDTITFDLGSQPQTITLDGNELLIYDDLVIQGPGADLLSIDADGRSRVMRIDNSAKSVQLAGLNIRGGDATGLSLTFGGGILTYSDDLRIHDSRLESNRAASGGGIMAFGKTIITNSTLMLNETINFGGAVYVNGAELDLSGSLIDGNTSGNYGGGVYGISASVITVANSTFSGNEARGGGAILMDNRGTLHVSDSTFLDNQATTLWGGSIWNEPDAQASLVRTTFRNNRATHGGAVLNYGKLAVLDSLFDHNVATTSSGGAIYNGNNSTVTLDVRGSTFVDNRAISGGAIYNNLSQVDIVGSTFSANSATLFGGAVYSSLSPSSYLSIDSSTITDNSASSEDYAFGRGGGLYLSGSAGNVKLNNSIVVGNSSAYLNPDIFTPSALSVQSSMIGEGGGGTTSSFGDHLYEVVSVAGGITWEDARDAASRAGGYLVSIETVAENNFVKALIDDPLYWNSVQDNDNYYNHGPWIGGLQSKDSIEPAGGFRWQTGSSVSSSTAFWYTGEPSNFRGNEDAISFFSATSGASASTGDWNDSWRLSTDAVAYIIEYDFSQFDDTNLFAVDPFARSAAVQRWFHAHACARS
ncbi:MAG: choice-of-anchor Q domain-containing protein [Pirellulaceae bacterium]